jgi:hypothetical protein
MSSDDGTVYMMRGGSGDDGADEWVSPEPAGAVITDAIVAATELTAEDVGEIETYVDTAELRAVIGDGEEAAVTFAVEGHEVTVTADGDVEVET